MSFPCSVCGELHEERPAIAFNTPHYYHILSEEDKASLATLSEDFCIIEYGDQTDRFIRAVLNIPVKDSEFNMEYGVWVSLSEKNFEHYMDHFNDDLEGETFFGYLCSSIPGYENTLLLKTNVVCGTVNQRPQVFPHASQSDNVFVKDFTEGISQEEADRRIHLIIDNA